MAPTTRKMAIKAMKNAAKERVTTSKPSTSKQTTENKGKGYTFERVSYRGASGSLATGRPINQRLNNINVQPEINVLDHINDDAPNEIEIANIVPEVQIPGNDEGNNDAQFADAENGNNDNVQPPANERNEENESESDAEHIEVNKEEARAKRVHLKHPSDEIRLNGYHVPFKSKKFGRCRLRNCNSKTMYQCANKECRMHLCCDRPKKKFTDETQLAKAAFISTLADDEKNCFVCYHYFKAPILVNENTENYFLFILLFSLFIFFYSIKLSVTIKLFKSTIKSTMTFGR